jgi:hypothetical protein
MTKRGWSLKGTTRLFSGVECVGQLLLVVRLRGPHAVADAGPDVLVVIAAHTESKALPGETTTQSWLISHETRLLMMK